VSLEAADQLPAIVRAQGRFDPGAHRALADDLDAEVVDEGVAARAGAGGHQVASPLVDARPIALAPHLDHELAA
jgi:hypothetical protein